MENGKRRLAYRENGHSTDDRRHDDEDGAAEEGHQCHFSADADADGPEELYVSQ
jgi:hypothetical protein